LFHSGEDGFGEFEGRSLNYEILKRRKPRDSKNESKKLFKMNQRVAKLLELSHCFRYNITYILSMEI
jgi:hypothetical protein